MSSRWIPRWWTLTTRWLCEKGERSMKKALKILAKLLGKLLVIGLVTFVATFALYMFNGENKLIYYVIRPLLNKHYDSQVRDRRIV